MNSIKSKQTEPPNPRGRCRQTNGADRGLSRFAIRSVVAAGVLLAMLTCFGCHNDQRIIDKHEQALEQEED